MKFFGLLKSKKGLSLLEMIITISIVGLVVVGAFSAFMFGFRSYARNNKQNDLQSEVARAANELTDSIRYATKISNSTGENIYIVSHEINAENTELTYSVSGGSLEFTIYAEKEDISYEITRKVYLVNFDEGSSDLTGTEEISYDLPVEFETSGE